jgi:hypothetical protein
MPSKKTKTAITSLPEKPVPAKDASSVKGGRTRDGRLATNHNQTLLRF